MYTHPWKTYLRKLKRQTNHRRPTACAAIVLIRSYQILVSPLIGPACRFSPTCSEYALEAVKRYGTLKGAFLAVKRILRCHPWNAGGFDPVP